MTLLPHKQSGFSLVELSVVLTVIGITLGGALELATQKTEAEKLNETNAKMDLIETALEQFLIINQRLPCPASGSLRLDEANFGIEGTPSATECGSSNFDDTVNIHAGVVPVKTLELPDNTAFDGWGRRISYAVDYRMANSGPPAPYGGATNGTNGNCDGTTSSICFQYTTIVTSITIRSDVAPAGADITTEAIYTLISHGKNGFGAFRRYGSATRNGPSADGSEQENSETHTSGDHQTFDSTFVQKTSTATFDDVVRYRTKWQLLDAANAVTSAATCTAASDVFSGPGSNLTCGNANNITTCEDLGNAVHKLCLQQ